MLTAILMAQLRFIESLFIWPEQGFCFGRKLLAADPKFCFNGSAFSG